MARSKDASTSKSAHDGDRRDLIDGYLAYYPTLRRRIIRQLLLALHSRRFLTLDELYADVRERAGTTDTSPEEPADPLEEELQGLEEDPGLNVAVAHRWSEAERALIEEVVVASAAKYFTAGELDSLVLLTRKRNEAEHLNQIANDSESSFERLRQKLEEYCEMPGAWVRLPESEAIGVRVALIRRFISEQLDFIGVAKKHLTLRDLNPLMKASIGAPDGAGRLGGKAAGMLLAASILRDAQIEGDQGFGPLKTPESIFLRTDLFNQFLKHNDLIEYANQKYKSIDDVRAEFPAVREVFKNAEFPDDMVRQLRTRLERIGPHPLIVRSSSLLEDNFNYAFSGKYYSIFLGNQGDLEDRLTQLLGAISEVYASTVGPDPIAYRRRRKLIDYDEMMGVIIQKVVGRKAGRYFLPAWAGVAFSHNDYRWNKRIKKEDGLVRLVMGLGSRAVDRVGGDYPRMIALGAPTLRPEADAEQICRYSQHFVDVIDLEKNKFRSIPLAKVIEQGPFPILDQIVSVYRDGELTSPVSRRVDARPEELVVTFDKLLSTTDFVPRMRWILGSIERAYGRHVDVEFAFDGRDFYVLQCRPLSSRMEIPEVPVPQGMPPESCLFSANRDVSSAAIRGIEYIVYVDPSAYDRLETSSDRREVAGIIGKLNHRLEGHEFILVGPGRWGTSDVRLGVGVSYADINNTRLLVEVSRDGGSFQPQVSFGTHFFQDLVESGIHHLPLHPDEPDIIFRAAFFEKAPNHLATFLPEAASRGDVIRVVRVPEAAGGRVLDIVMDGVKEQALAYLTECTDP